MPGPQAHCGTLGLEDGQAGEESLMGGLGTLEASGECDNACQIEPGRAHRLTDPATCAIHGVDAVALAPLAQGYHSLAPPGMSRATPAMFSAASLNLAASAELV